MPGNKRTLDSWLVNPSKKLKESQTTEKKGNTSFKTNVLNNDDSSTEKIDEIITNFETQPCLHEKDEVNSILPSKNTISDESVINVSPYSCGLATEAGILEVADQFSPTSEFKFPKTKGRSCLSSWFNAYRWLHYDKNRDLVFCFTCVKAVEQQNSRDFKNVETSFITSGFKNWKKAIEKFKAHEKSSFHSKSVHYLLQKEKGVPVIDLISAKSLSEQNQSRAALKTVVSSIRYLARSGQAIRGSYGDCEIGETGNLIKLLEERTEDIPFLKQWMEKRNNFLSGDIQNEIIEILAHTLQRELVESINKSPYLGLIADGTTDISGTEQFSIVIRHLDCDSLEPNETFVGMYSAPDCTSNTLFSIIKDMFLRLGLDISKLRGHCFDGAANMSGKFHGVQSQLVSLQPKSMYVHCANHSLDLVLQELARQSDVICDALSLVRNVSGIILDSAKRRAIYKNIVLDNTFEENLQKPKNVLALCPTRWAVRCNAIARFLENYKRIKETLKEILNDSNSMRDERRSAVKGYLHIMNKFETVLGLQISLVIFSPCENLSVSLQKSGYMASDIKKAVNILISAFNKQRNEEEFNKIWDKTLSFENLIPPAESRKKKIPKRLEHTDTPTEPANLSAKKKLRCSYFEIIDLILNELQRRFNQIGFERLIKLEAILFENSSNSTPENVKENLGIYADEFDIKKLSAQLTLLPSFLENETISLQNIIKALNTESQMIRNLFSEVIRLISLILSTPATVASAERSFSSLKHVKTYLRSTMTQKRLTHLLLLCIHESRTKSLSLDRVMNEFISRTAERKSVFGFKPTCTI